MGVGAFPGAVYRNGAVSRRVRALGEQPPQAVPKPLQGLVPWATCFMGAALLRHLGRRQQERGGRRHPGLHAHPGALCAAPCHVGQQVDREGDARVVRRSAVQDGSAREAAQLAARIQPDELALARLQAQRPASAVLGSDRLHRGFRAGGATGREGWGRVLLFHALSVEP